MKPINHHCSVVSIDGAGVLIEGAAGSGKTSLALGMIDTALARGLKAALVCDDQAICDCRAGRLTASAPPALAGLAEIRGYGIAPVPFVADCEIAMIARLVPDAQMVRMPEPETETFLGVELPLVRLPERHEQQGVRIVLAWLTGRRGVA